MHKRKNPMRAKPHGRVTRRSLAVKRQGTTDGKPLPLHLACLPQRLSPTPHNPGCAETRTQYGTQVLLSKEHSGFWFLGMEGLDPTGRWAVYCEGNTGYANDWDYALAWVRAAKSFGLDARLYV